MNKWLLDSLMEDADFTDIMYGDVVEEGATWETIKTVANADTKKIKLAYRDAQRLYQNGDKTGAIKKVNECKDGFNNLKNQLNRIDDDFISDFCGFLIGGGILQLFLNIKSSGTKGFNEWMKAYALKFVGGLIIPGAGVILGTAVKLSMNQNNGVHTGNYVKSDVIKAIDENIKMCDKLIERIKNDNN